eukprot:41413-Eustigmatos_ZCMA.PRE.1
MAILLVKYGKKDEISDRGYFAQAGIHSTQKKKTLAHLQVIREGDALLQLIKEPGAVADLIEVVREQLVHLMQQREVLFEARCDGRLGQQLPPRLCTLLQPLTCRIN